MVDLSGGPEGPIEHGFSNSVFIVPAIIVVGLTVLTRLVSCLLTLLILYVAVAHTAQPGTAVGSLELSAEVKTVKGSDLQCRLFYPKLKMSEIRVSHFDAQDQLDGLGEISEGVEIPKDFIKADGSFEAPSLEKIMEALEGMSGLSIEDKEGLKSQLLQQKMREAYGEEMESTWGEIPAGSFLANQTFILFSLLCVIALIFVFFGLKLYRSLVEKERKREEKRKLKMQKKKK